MSSKPSIFISYRRDDSEDVAVHIYDRLKDHFSTESVFFDIDTIPLGLDFEEYIDASVSQCQIFLAIIGRAWLTVTDDEGVPRLESETDFVRLEIESALKRKIPVIPLLVSRAKMPKRSELTESLRKLVSRNGVQIRSGKDFHKDIDELIKGIEAHFKNPNTNAASLTDSKAFSEHRPNFSKGKLQYFSFEIVTLDARGQKKARRTHSVEHFIEYLGNGVALDMVRIPGGSFLMGSPENEPERLHREGPQHRVKLSEFFMGRYPIVQAQWNVIAGMESVYRRLEINSSEFKDANRPVKNISWEETIEFCARLSKLVGKEYRLPSESEWEYACRAGTTTPFYFGETITTEVANFDGNYTYVAGPKGEYRRQTTEVGQFPANIFGLYDMHGNVWEWCSDIWHCSYEGAPTNGSTWIDGNEGESSHVFRGGSWFIDPGGCRSASRGNDRIPGIFQGFRVVCCA